MINLTIQIDEINYGQVAEKLLPLALEKLQGRFGEGQLGMFLGMASKLPPKAVGAMLDAMPQETKDELVVKLLNLKKDSIVTMAEQLAERKGIAVRIGAVEVSAE